MDNISFRDDILSFAWDQYRTAAEHLWARYPNYVVLRHQDNRKWYGIIMDVPKEKLGLAGSEKVDILNVKLDDLLLIDTLLQRDGYLKGYHFGSGNWISILLDGEVPLPEILGMLEKSFLVTASQAKKTVMRPAKEWLIPANPKYFDIMNAFNDKTEIDWKQGAGIKRGDTVYMYVAAPVSCIMFACKVTDTGIPCNIENEGLTIKTLMRIKLMKRYPEGLFTFARLSEQYDIYAVRGPRSVPQALSQALKS